MAAPGGAAPHWRSPPSCPPPRRAVEAFGTHDLRRMARGGAQDWRTLDGLIANLQRRFPGQEPGGVARGAQVRVGYVLGVPEVYLCSRSPPPGAGVHGLCGYDAADAVSLRSLVGHHYWDDVRLLGRCQ